MGAHGAPESAKEDGYRTVVVPEDIARALSGITDLNGNPMFDLDSYRQQFNDSFRFSFVDVNDLTAAERTVFELTPATAALAKLKLAQIGVREILISETMRMNERGAEFVGVWEPSNGRVIVRRDQLAKAADYCGTLLHELEHAASGWPDGCLEFEDALTQRIGITVSRALGAK